MTKWIGKVDLAKRKSQLGQCRPIWSKTIFNIQIELAANLLNGPSIPTGFGCHEKSIIFLAIKKV
jgi:hypothetical protein